MMKSKKPMKIGQSVLVLLLAAALIAGVAIQPHAQAKADTYQASSITKRDDLTVDYTKYLNGEVVYQLPDTIKSDEQISVIVTVDQINLMDAYEDSGKTVDFQTYALQNGASYQASMLGKRAELLEKLDEQGIAYTTGEVYNTLLSGYELVIRASDYSAVCQSLSKDCGIVVGEVYNTCETQLVENAVNVYDTGIFDSSNSGYDGSGMVVAVLDTGLDYNHTAFSVDNFTSQKLGMTYEDVAAVLDKTKAKEQAGSLSVDDVYINEKVPFSYDYADNDSDVFSTHNNHGTHVSGVIVGNDDVITGVAPNAQLVSMKIFSDVMDTSRTAWILAALEDCVILGVDVINMSLGTSCGFSTETEDELTGGAYQKVKDAGISLIVAASNSYSSAYGSEKNGNLGLTSNPDTGTVGSPSTYAGAMSVASISGEETPYLLYDKTVIYFDEATNGASEEKDFVTTLLGDTESQVYDYVIIPGVGRSADYTGVDVKGKIALVRRGDNTFEEKAMIAEAQGAAGIIVYNNVSGDIKMNVGDAALAVCSISQDDGKMLVEKGNGKITISKKQTSGPFISDFSSWGPTPDLGIKPEITAHGGNILSSVTGGGYDRQSGTSMACPNLAGVAVLMRQYVVENFPEIADDNLEVTNMVNCLLMSTADIALGTNGQPYFVRKQGAGLANLTSALETTAYITTYDRDDNAMDRAKLELGDDPEKTGVYQMHFAVHNFGSKKLTYNLGAYVMTEGVSENKTAAGDTTVTEEANILEGATLTVDSVNGEAHKGTKLTVPAGETVDVVVTITLSEEDKAYLDASFENGMYVEGFLTLTAASGTKIDLNVPYLAFYGDWTQAPIFDLDYFDTNADELDDSIATEDKIRADAYATRPIGGVSGDYVSYLGSYYFLQDPDDMTISAKREYAALSNQEGTVHSLRFVWAGLLRSAKQIDVQITDDTTGEVIYETETKDVRKSYGDGGTPYPANVEIEFDTQDYNLANNSTYTVTVTGYMDYGDGGVANNKKNVFQFPLTVDFEAPAITNVEYSFEYDKTLKKNRLYAYVDIYDNHYTMAAQLSYVTEGEDENGDSTAEMKTFGNYMTPVYSEKNSTTTVKFELTDYIYQIKENALNQNTFTITCYDYALNYATYEIGLPVAYSDFYLDGITEEGLTLSPNEVYTLEPLVSPSTEWAELLTITSSKPSVVRVVNNKLVATKSGTVTIKVSDPTTGKSITFPVTVLKEGDEGYKKYDKPVADVFTLTGYTTQKAYYRVSNSDRDIGDTGDTRFFEGNYSLSMYPSETVLLNYDLAAYFPNDTTVSYESTNENIVKVDSIGNVTAVGEGYASVTIKVMLDGKSTYYSESVSVEVKDPYITSGPVLTNYYGNGGLVQIPEDLHLIQIGSFAFANSQYVDKNEEELEFDDAETTKQWFIGESTITKVIVPEGVELIGSYAFANLTGLEEIVLPSTLEAIDYGAFYGCSALKKITFSSENNLKTINKSAFENCALEGTLDLSSVCRISEYAFAGNKSLEGITTSDSLISIGDYAFASCSKLSDVTITAQKVKYGAYAFNGCEALTSFYVNASVLPEGMFYQATALESVTIGPDVNEIGEFAFRDTAVSTLEVAEGNNAFKVQSADHVVSADGKTLIAVAASLTGEYTGSEGITVIGDGAFSHNTKIRSVVLPNVTQVGEYGFGSASSLKSVTLGVLESIGEYAFFETGITEMPAFTADTQIGKYAFAYTNITSVTIPDGMTIAEGAFSQILRLESVTIGNDVTLEDYAFNMSKDNSYKIRSYDEDGEKYFYYEFSTGLKELTIGDNVNIGKSAFAYHASLESVTLGANAVIGDQGFYSCASLSTIDLSKVKSIGQYAFSGDEYYICMDENMVYAAVSSEGQYMTTIHSTALTFADLSSLEFIDEYAFALCDDLTQVIINDNITEIPQYAFASCKKLSNIDLSKVQVIGDYAFQAIEDLASIDLSSATSLGKYAFVNNAGLTTVTLNPEGTDTDEGSFAYCVALKQVINLDKCKNIGDYAFAYNVMDEVVLTDAENIGRLAFMKEEKAPMKVTLGENLKTLGDNPFALCVLEPFCQVETVEFNGKTEEKKIYDYTISDTVQVINGSLYCAVDTGLELTTYASPDGTSVTVADDTVRITSMAFAGSDVQMVTMPATVFSIGHKAFFDCQQLHTVVFGSYEAPILEEEFEPLQYETFECIPGSGFYGEYTDYDGNVVEVNGIELVPYYMWNVTSGLYFDVYYGATFIDYVGTLDHKLTMVRPVNGTNYDAFVISQYFDTVIDGANAPDKNTLATIAAIKAIPERVSYEQRAIVENARALYSKIGTLEQQALVSNYADLVTAEQRIIALTPTDEPTPTEPEVPEKTGLAGGVILAIVLGALILAGAIAIVVVALIGSKKNGISFAESLRAVLKTIGGYVKTAAKAVAAFAVKVWGYIVIGAKKIAELAVKLWKTVAEKCKTFAQHMAEKKAAKENAPEENGEADEGECAEEVTEETETTEETAETEQTVEAEEAQTVEETEDSQQ